MHEITCSRCGLTWSGGNAARWFSPHRESCLGTPSPSVETLYLWLAVEVGPDHGCLIPTKNIKGQVSKTSYNKIVGSGSRVIGETWAHRAVLVVASGPIPDGLTASHTCTDYGGTKSCVNVDHLVAEPLRDNHARISFDVRSASGKAAMASNLEKYPDWGHLGSSKAGSITTSMRRRCVECGLIAWPGAMGMHLKHSGHSGYTDVEL